MSSRGLLVGAGPMAATYVAVLDALQMDYDIVGRGEASAAAMRETCGKPVGSGGLEAWLAQDASTPAWAIVATGVPELGPSVEALIGRGVRDVLVEKPGALDREGIERLAARAESAAARVIVAYNRRSYASVRRAREIIEEDGGLQSVAFEFTEWSHMIRSLPKAPGVKEAWFLGNSTHVADLAFHLAGEPVEIAAFTSGSLDWHPSAAVFAGAGRTDRGVLFSYHANWGAPGRWVVEAMTAKHRLIFRPMEKLHVTRIGSVRVEELAIDDRVDLEFKAGVHEQVRCFLARDDRHACTLQEQRSRWAVYCRIAGYA